MPTDKHSGRHIPAKTQAQLAEEARRAWADKVAPEQVEEALNDLHGYIDEFLTKSVEGDTFADGARGDFVADMKEKYGGGADEGKGDITDALSTSRLRLIQETNVRTNWGEGQFTEGLDPAILDAFPAARFVRVGFVQEPREIHEAHLGEVHLKDDIAFWLSMNTPEDGGFDVPYAPFGYNSQCDVEDVSRQEAIDLGLIGEDEQIVPPDQAWKEHLDNDGG